MHFYVLSSDRVDCPSPDLVILRGLWGSEYSEQRRSTEAMHECLLCRAPSRPLAPRSFAVTRTYRYLGTFGADDPEDALWGAVTAEKG